MYWRAKLGFLSFDRYSLLVLMYMLGTKLKDKFASQQCLVHWSQGMCKSCLYIALTSGAAICGWAVNYTAALWQWLELGLLGGQHILHWITWHPMLPSCMLKYLMVNKNMKNQRKASSCFMSTHWGRDNMAAISQTFFLIKMCEFLWRFHWSS